MELEIHPIEMIKAIKYKKKKQKSSVYPYSRLRGIHAEHKENGKTLSAEYTIKKRLKDYPKAIFITNVEIKGIKNKTIYFSNSNELVEVLKENIIAEQREGYVIFIDEIHVVLAELFRKNRPNFSNIFKSAKKIKYKYYRDFTNV